MSISLITSGFHTTLQDEGRIGKARFGVPKSGPMDSFLAQMANFLIGNPVLLPTLEIALSGPKIRFNQPAIIAITGLEAKILLNREEILINKSYKLQAGDILDIKSVIRGVYVYLAVSGGFQGEKILGSQSMYKSLYNQDKYLKGDEILFHSSHLIPEKKSSKINLNLEFYNTEEIKVRRGLDWEKLSEEIRDQLINRPFTISKLFNRQGIRLNERIKGDIPEIITQPVLPGTIQLTRGGLLMVLMRDAQVTGGYPRVLQLNELSINKIAQKRPNENILFIFEK